MPDLPSRPAAALPGPLWLDDLPHAGDPPGLQGEARVDVAIVGGGLVGLWTAWHLKQLEPGLRIAILEQDRCGAGASGRNGGFVMSWWSKIACLERVCGRDDAFWLAGQSTAAIAGLGGFLDSHGIDAELRMQGWLWTATAPAHVGCWQPLLEYLDRHGQGRVFLPLAQEEVVRRTGSPRHLGGVLESVNGTVHPARLARGLAEVVRGLGVAIHERTPVLALERSRPARLRCPRGVVIADRVVLATNAWAAGIPELARSFVCVTSAIAATPPIPERLAAIGWTGGESITDSQTTVLYYRTTRAGRILFGKGGGTLARTGPPAPWMFDHAPSMARAVADFRRIYPMLADVPIERAWSGPIDRTLDGLPMLGCLPDAAHIAYGIGWSGNGVGPSRLGGRILAGLALQRRERETGNGLIGRPLRSFPPEPWRWLGGSALRGALARIDRAHLAGRRPAWIDRGLRALAPRGFEEG